MTVQGKTYDTLKWVAQILLPALGTLYFTLAQIWGLPSAEEVVGTIVAVDAFLGILLGISQVNFNAQVAKGTIDVVDQPEGGVKYSLNLDENPENLRDKKRAVFDIVDDEKGLSSLEIIGILCLIGIVGILIVLL